MCIYIHYVWCILKGFVWSIPHFQTNTCFLAMSQNPGTIGTHSHSWCSWMLIPPVMLLTWPIHIWGFPEMGAPHTIIHLNKMFHQKNHPALGPNPHENQKKTAVYHCTTGTFHAASPWSPPFGVASATPWYAPGSRRPSRRHGPRRCWECLAWRRWAFCDGYNERFKNDQNL